MREQGTQTDHAVRERSSDKCHTEFKNCTE